MVGSIRCAQYTKLAELYDLFTDDIDHEAWTDYICGFIEGHASSILECGCGTGEITIRLKKRGFDITGSDISSEMLAVASEKARKAGVRLPFVKMDMCRIALHRQTDIIIAPCDCVNYLTSANACEEFFRSAFAALKSGGMLLFDVSSRYKLQNILGMNVFSDSRDDAAYVWRNNYDEKSKLLELELEFFMLADKMAYGEPLYRRFIETHIQRAHSERELRAWLESAGFAVKVVYEAFTFNAPSESSERLQFAAIKP